MKLIDMLVEEGLSGWRWPEGYYSVAQDKNDAYGGNIYAYINALSLGDYWSEDNDSGFGLLLFEGYEVAEDAATSLVTREQYEAALAARNEGWIEWGGGECPVKKGTLVDVKFPDGMTSSDAQPAGSYRWTLRNCVDDIAAYRLHKPQEVGQAKADLNECASQDAAPVWNGEGLPPVGCMCERSWAGDEWQLCKILFASNQLVVVKLKDSGVEDAYSTGYVTFRPLCTEAERKREAAIKELTSVICREIPDTGMATAAKYAARAYDAIAAGKITGVKLEGL